jgi:membrane protease YdiL (CAAX protease family)
MSDEKSYEALTIRDIMGEAADNVRMSPGIRDRIRRLAWRDRLLLLLTGGWAILGIPGNYFRVHGLMHGSGQYWLLLTMVLWATIPGVVAYSVIRQKRRPADYGFSFKSGGVASLAVLAVIHGYLVISGKFALSAPENYLLSAVGALVEELAFRAIAIDRFILLMDGTKAKAFWAILASSALWSLPHIPSKSPAQLLPGIFLGGVFFGYVYYKSRSILLPAWIHAVANAGYLGGILIAGLYCLTSFADWAFWSWRKQTPPAAGASRNIDAIHLDV